MCTKVGFSFQYPPLPDPFLSLSKKENQDVCNKFLNEHSDFKDGGIDWDNCVHISEKRWAEAPEIHIKNGDLLITKDGTVGKVAIVSGLDGKASLNSGVLLVRTYENFEK